MFDLAKGVCAIGRLVESLDAHDLDGLASTAGQPPAPLASVTVDLEQPLTGGDGTTVGRLLPGHAYRAGRAEGGWLQVTDDAGVTGWVAESAVTRS